MISSTAKYVREEYARIQNSISEKYQKEGTDITGIGGVLHGLFSTQQDTLDRPNESDEQFMARLRSYGIFITQWEFDEKKMKSFRALR